MEFDFVIAFALSFVCFHQKLLRAAGMFVGSIIFMRSYGDMMALQ